MVRLRLRRKTLLVLLTVVMTVVVVTFRSFDDVTVGYPEEPAGDSSGVHDFPEKAPKISNSIMATSTPDSWTSSFSSLDAVLSHPHQAVDKSTRNTMYSRSGKARTVEDAPSWEPGQLETYEPKATFVLRGAEGKDVQQPERRGTRIRKRQSISHEMEQEISATIFQDPSWSPQTSTVSIFADEVTNVSSSLDPRSRSTFPTKIYDTTYEYEYMYDISEPDYIPEIKEISFTRVLFLCEYIFSAVYGEYSNFTDTRIPYGNDSLAIVTNQKFLNVCIPFYRVIYGSECTQISLITVCYPEEIAFLHSHGCRRPSSEDQYFELLLASTLLAEDDVCYEAVCNGSLRVVERIARGASILLISPYATQGNNGTCYQYVQTVLEGTLAGKRLYVTSNRHWPTCFPGYDVWWTAQPEAVGLVGSWSYLPLRCRVGEGFLVLLVTCIALSGLVGNVVVLAVMVNRSQRSEASDILRTSLAAADLLLCLFVVMPSLDAHLSFMDGRSVGSDIVSSEVQTPEGSTVIDGGFRLFSAIVMSSCSCISLLSLFALSLERFAATSDTIQYKVVFTRARVRGYVVMTWMSSLLGSLALTNSKDGILALWYSFYKLPLGVSPRGLETALPVTVAILGLVCLLTTILSALALYNYVKKEARRSAELQDLGETDLNQSTEMPKYVVAIMALVTVLFLLSTTLAGLVCLLHILDAHFDGVELVGYLCWWGFMAASSCNPFLYNLPSQRFRGDAAAFLRTLLQKKQIFQAWIHRHTRPRQETTSAITDVPRDATPGEHHTTSGASLNLYRETTV